jgi:uncharacterized protein (TIGR03083 family)
MSAGGRSWGIIVALIPEAKEPDMQPENENDAITTANLLGRIGRGWDDLQAMIARLSREQLTGPADAAGWTVKDHLIHLAAWEDGIAAMLGGHSRLEAMGIDQATWESGTDAVNEAIYERNRELGLDAALERCRQVHQRLLDRIGAMSDADLLRPYSDFQPEAASAQPILGWIVGNSFGHYAEHRPWIEAIIAAGP